MLTIEVASAPDNHSLTKPLMKPHCTATATATATKVIHSKNSRGDQLIENADQHANEVSWRVLQIPVGGYFVESYSGTCIASLLM